MSATSDGTLFASFTQSNLHGTWEFNGSWHRLTNSVASQIDAVSDNSFFATMTPPSLNGTYVYNNGHWHRITGNVGFIGHDGSTLIEGFSSSTWIDENGHVDKVSAPRAYAFG
jgi:hypothetical protein